jgi:hypothetical protein
LSEYVGGKEVRNAYILLIENILEDTQKNFKEDPKDVG